MNLLFVLQLLLTAPTQPTVTLLVLDSSDSGAVERVRTSLAVLPTISVAMEGVFPQSQKNSITTAVNSLGSFPSKLGVGVLRKQLKRRKLDALVVVGKRGLYLVTRTSLRGPYKLPGPRKGLAPGLVAQLGGANKAPPKRIKKKKTMPWWKNWIFWTGVAVITGSVIAVSLLTQEPDSVDLHVRYPGK